MDPVASRVQANLAECQDILKYKGEDRLAARWLFSCLAHLEGIAVIMANRGEQVPGQLQDEIVHQMTFQHLATACGGLQPEPKAIERLRVFVESTRGPASALVLNIFAEQWLEKVFEEIVHWGPASSMWASILEDEQRHTSAQPELICANHHNDAVRTLETKLFQIVRDPFFLFPLIWFGGVAGAARIGTHCRQAHEETLAELGMKPGPHAITLGQCAEDALDAGDAVPVEHSAWQDTAIRIDQGPIHDHDWVRCRWPEHEFEGRLVRAVHWALEKHPELNRTIHNPREEILQPLRPTVAVRRLWRDTQNVITLHVRRKVDHGLCRRYLGLLNKHANEAPYSAIPEFRGLELIMPDPLAAVSVTNVSPFGCTVGSPSFNEVEGNTIAISIGTPRGHLWWRRAPLSFAVDHRVHNGRELGLITQAVSYAFTKGF